MRTICLNQGPFQLSESVATIGVFDGVHAGHQLLIRMVREEARSRGLCPMVITFDRQPRQVLDPTFRPQVLTTLEEKEAIIASLGVETLVVLPFTKDLAALTARDFMQQVLRQQLHVRTLITGYDNRFGRNRAEGFDGAVSSSVIRQLLAEEGRVDLMPQCLTRQYQLSGQVMPGEHIGHQLGFPTANLELLSADKLIPAPGVYAVWATLEDGQRRAAMMNIGTRPTFEGKRQTLEVNILDFEGNLYGQQVTIAFVTRLREEQRFSSPEALVAQLKEDKEKVRKILV